MNFQRGNTREEPEINLIPMIDVLLVILIFLMVTTSYAKYSELHINLPEAGGQAETTQTQSVTISIDATAHYTINTTSVQFTNISQLTAAIKTAAGRQTDPMIVINADAKTPHQAVINAMESARRAGFGRITFATQMAPQ